MIGSYQRGSTPHYKFGADGMVVRIHSPLKKCEVKGLFRSGLRADTEGGSTPPPRPLSLILLSNALLRFGLPQGAPFYFLAGCHRRCQPFLSFIPVLQIILALYYTKVLNR